MSSPLEIAGGPAVAWRDASERGVVLVRGSDRVRFLNGMLTQDVENLAAGCSIPALQLDRRGHVLARLEVGVLEDHILLDVAAGATEVLIETLEKHIIADDVVLETPVWRQIVLEGPEAPTQIEALGGPMLSDGQIREHEELVWVAGGGFTPHARRILGPPAAVEALVARLNVPTIEAETAEMLRIQAFVPLLGRDTDERTFPQEARLEAAVSFSKGCYIGQEIVARIYSRGSVNRLLVQLHSQGDLPPGAEISADGRSTGRVTSAASAADGGFLAMAWVRREHAVPGTRLDVAGVTASVTGPALES